MTDSSHTAHLPDDDRSRSLTLARPETDQSLTHLAIVGDTYTILVTGAETAGKYTLIDMLIPPGGGPGPHRHDFEEMFTVLEGEIELTFRGQTSTARAGETVNIPANAPHQFGNKTQREVRLLCLCAPAGQDDFFKAIGTPVATRTTPAPTMSEAQQAEFKRKSAELAPQYKTELLQHA